jgi:peptide-methionine (S)-S-oxide reductase
VASKARTSARGELMFIWSVVFVTLCQFAVQWAIERFLLEEGAMATDSEVAILGGGCFWCLEAVFLEVRGITKVESGYMGGHLKDPGYEQVCDGSTGHAEVVRLEFDRAVISYRDILEIFFTIHDPTTLNRQGNDVGTQYRSVIFHTSPDQEALARQVMAEMAAVWDGPIVTQIAPAETWYKAEDYHQDYFRQHPLQGYCAFVVAPKVQKFKSTFKHRLK